MGAPKISRRGFLASTALGSTLIGGGLAGCATHAMAPAPGAADVLGEDAARSLTVMARRLYPHDALDDAVYREVVDGVVADAAGDPATRAVLEEGVRALDSARPGGWRTLDEAEQIAVFAEMEDTAFFAAMRGGVQARLYDHPAAWAVLNYAGPSLPFGGYAAVGGFDDIDWLPQDGGEA